MAVRSTDSANLHKSRVVSRSQQKCPKWSCPPSRLNPSCPSIPTEVPQMELSSAVGAVPSALQAQSNNANTSAPPSTTASDADVNLSRINTSVDDVCHNLRLDLQLSRTARKLVKKLLDDSSVCHERQHVMSVSNQSAWICCAVFVANHLTGIEKNIVSLTQLLMTANVRCVCVNALSCIPGPMGVVV